MHSLHRSKAQTKTGAANAIPGEKSAVTRKVTTDECQWEAKVQFGKL